MVKITATVEGMKCPMCEKRVNNAVSKALVVESVVSDHEKNLTEIVAAEALDPEKVREVITAAGYPCTAVTSEPCGE